MHIIITHKHGKDGSV